MLVRSRRCQVIVCGVAVCLFYDLTMPEWLTTNQMEDRTVTNTDPPIKPGRNPVRWCLDRLKSGSSLLWLLCAVSWFVCGVCRLKVYHVESRLESLEARFEQLSVLAGVPSQNELNARIKSVMRQVRCIPLFGDRGYSCHSYTVWNITGPNWRMRCYVLFIFT